MDLSTSLSESIKDDSIDTGSELLECGIDLFLDDGLVQDVPLISTVIGIYKIGKSINELHLLKKLRKFVNAINTNSASQNVIDKYKLELKNNSKKRSKELEHLLILINRYINESDTEMLANFYLAYLDNTINWNELCVCAEIIDRLLPGDFECLKNHSKWTITDNEGTENALRLMSLGLLMNKESVIENGTFELCNVVIEGKSIHDYVRTELGNKFVQIALG